MNFDMVVPVAPPAVRDDVIFEDDGTFTVFLDAFHTNPITGVPSYELAAAIAEAIWEAQSGRP